MNKIKEIKIEWENNDDAINTSELVDAIERLTDKVNEIISVVNNNN